VRTVRADQGEESRQEGAALRARPLRDQVRELIEFDLPLVALNTALLLVSSITFGQAIPHMEAGRVGPIAKRR
jgi:heme/copper-type cytochrome/quinol oxidase subunit 3